MNKKLLLLALIFFNLSSFGDSKEEGSDIINADKSDQLVNYFVSEKVPLEIEFILNSIKWNKLSKNESQKLKGYINGLDKSFQFLTKEQIFRISKIEIYKQILKMNKASKVKISEIVKSIPEKMTAKTKDENYTYSDFSKWLIQAISSDFEQILKDPNFYDYKTKMINKQKIVSKSLRTIDKKILLLVNWYKKIVFSSDSDLNSQCEEIGKYLLEKLNLLFKVVLSQTLEEENLEKWKLPNEKLVHFERVEKTSSEQKIQDTLTDVINEIDSKETSVEEKVKLIEPNEWRPSETEGLVRPRNYPEKDPNYIPPKELPKPVNDWIFNI